MNRIIRLLGLGLVMSTMVAGASLAAAQPDKSSSKYALTVTLDKPDALYQVGETVTFSVRLRRNAEPVEGARVSWSVSKDGMPPVQSGQSELKNGSAMITATLAEPGFLLCRAIFQTPTKTSMSALCGAGIEPLKIGPSLPVPQDFDGFWSDQKQELAQVPVNARLTPVDPPQAGLECFDVQADCVGAPVSGYFARPVGAQPKSLPIVLTVHGAGVRSSILAAAAGWARQGFLAMDINAHGLPNGQPDSFYTERARGDLSDYRIRGREARDSIYFRGMFLRLVRAIDFLTAQPEWNERTLVVTGSSQGGAQSIVAAGIDPRVTFFAAGVPAMCDHTGIVVGRINGWPKFLPSPSNDPPDPRVVEAVRYYDAMNFATRTQAAGMVTVGFVDTTCPPTSVYATYNVLRGKKEIFNDPPSGHAMSPPAGEALRAAILRHVAENR